jgi:homoserine dehydrogenase
MSDLLSVLRGNIKYPFGIASNKRNKSAIYDVNNYVNSLYMRFEVKDKSGVLSQITKQLAKYKISIQRLIQIPDNIKKKASIIIITHNVREYYSKKCVNSFRSNKNIIKKPTVIRLF